MKKYFESQPAVHIEKPLQCDEEKLIPGCKETVKLGFLLK